MIQKTTQRQLNAVLGNGDPPRPAPANWGQSIRDKHYELEVVQHPVRARMCGFGDKDRRPLAPAAVAKMIVRRQDNTILDVDDVDIDFFVVTVDLWSADGTQEMNLVLHPSGGERYLPVHAKPRKKPYPSPRPSASFPLRPVDPRTPPGPTPALLIPHPHPPTHPHPHPYLYPTTDPYAPWSASYPVLPVPRPSSNLATFRPWNDPPPPSLLDGPPRDAPRWSNDPFPPPAPTTPPPPSPPTPTPTSPPTPTHARHPPYTRTLMGPLCANAQRLQDEHRKPGIFFLFQDLSIRTEGTFRLRMRLMNVGTPPAPNAQSNAVHEGTSPVLAQTFTEPFDVYSAKRFPGVPDTTALSIAFGNQGQKLPLRNRHGPRVRIRRFRRREEESDDDSA